MNNSNKRNPDTRVLCTRSEHRQGFNDGTYWAAKTAILKDNLITERSNQEVAYVSSAVGGSLSQVSFQNSRTKSRTGTPRCGGTKGRVKGFSRVSRRNLLRKFTRINRTAFRNYKGRVFFLTLTYPTEYQEDYRLCKRDLKAFYKRLKRRFGEFAVFWRTGAQKRGAFHFHLLLFIPPSPGLLEDLRRFVPSSWYEVCGEVGEGHLLRGTRVEEIRNWREVTSYAERYMAKEEEFPEGVETGRIWGTWNEKLLPIQWETMKVGVQDVYRIRRVYRRLAKRRGTGSLRRLSVFVRHQNVLKLPEFLGYGQKE